MENVTVTLRDSFTGELINRTMCALNAFKSGEHCWEKSNEQSQRESLERWVSERGNDQHETLLEVVDWKFSK